MFQATIIYGGGGGESTLNKNIITLNLTDSITLYTNSLKSHSISHIHFLAQDSILEPNCISTCTKALNSGTDILWFNSKKVVSKKIQSINETMYNTEHKNNFEVTKKVTYKVIDECSTNTDTLSLYGYSKAMNINSFTWIKKTLDVSRDFNRDFGGEFSGDFFSLFINDTCKNIDSIESNFDKSFINDCIFSLKFILKHNLQDCLLHSDRIFGILAFLNADNIYVLPESLSTNLNNTSPKDYFSTLTYLLDYIDSIKTNTFIYTSILEIFIYPYFLKALLKAIKDDDKKTINILESISSKFKNIKHYGLNFYIKNTLEYTLGTMIESVKKDKKAALKLPFRISQKIKAYKSIKCKYENLAKKYPFLATLNISPKDYADYDDALFNSRAFTLGKEILKAYKYRFIGGYFMLAIKFILISQRHKRKRKSGNRNIIKSKCCSKLQGIESKKLIINSMYVGIGDYLAMNPMLPFVREHYADYEISLLITPNFMDICLNCDKEYINKIIYFELVNKECILDDLKAYFADKEYDILLFPYEYDFNQDSLNQIIQAKEKIASYGTTSGMSKIQREARKKYYTKIIYPSELPMFQIYRNKEFFESLFNKTLHIKSLQFKLDKDKYASINFDFSKDYAIIFPVATAIERTWDIYNFEIVATHLYKTYGIISYLLGSGYDKNVANKIKNDTYIFSLCGTHTLDEVCYILSKSKIVICNDSGGYHLAMRSANNIIVISGGGCFVINVNYPQEFRENKILSTPLPKDALNNPYAEYYSSHTLLNTITPQEICELIDTKHAKNF